MLFFPDFACKIILTVQEGRAIQVVSISFFRFGGAMARLWAFTQMGVARIALARAEGMNFWKLCGSGVGEGFTPLPNTGVYAILAAWDDQPTAQRQIAALGVFKAYRKRANECWTVFLAPSSSRGSWSGVQPFDAWADTDGAPIAALTRASIRPRAMMRFWGKEPPISKAIGANDSVLFKIGIGEAPLVRQVTFSIWPDASAMAAFARSGPHAEAIRAVREGDWFSEELYARFRVVGDDGAWGGRSPLKDAA